MASITIRSGDRTWTADQPRVFRIGREVSSDVVASDPTVSRRHAEVRAVGDGWEVVDLGSSSGTYVGGQRVERAQLTGTSVIGFGQGGRALQVTVTVQAAGAPGIPPGHLPAAGPAAPQPGVQPPPQQVPPPQRAPQPGFQSYAGPPPPLAGPGGPGGPGGFGGRLGGGPLDTPTMVTTGVVPGFGPGLLIRRRTGGDLRFPPGRPVRVGRDPSLEVVADDTAVSRLHATLEPGPGGWTWTDRSTSGTFVDGERKSTFTIEEPTEISLGHPTAGYELEVVPVVAAGEVQKTVARRRLRRNLVRVGVVAAVLLLLVGGGFVALRAFQDDDAPVATDDGLSDVELNRAKAASVLLTAFDDSDQPLYSGSGSIISDDGLILTNAHVGDPNAPGQGGGEFDVAYITVSLTSTDDDAPAAAAFRAAPIVSDGYLDIAVLQIGEDVDGNPVDPADLDLPEPLPVGDSDALRTGDEIVALGFPAIGNLNAMGDRPLTITEGVVSTFQADPIVGTERGSIDSDVRLGSGNSGGASIDENGEIVGLNTRVVTAASDSAGSITQGSALIVPVNLAEAVLDIAYDGGDPDYVSPYLEELEQASEVPPDATVAANGWSTTEEGDDCGGTSSEDDPQMLSGVGDGDTINAEYTVTGVPEGVPFAIELYDGQGTRLGTVSETWPYSTEAECIVLPYTIDGPQEVLVGVFFLGDSSSPVAQNPVVLR